MARINTGIGGGTGGSSSSRTDEEDDVPDPSEINQDDEVDTSAPESGSPTNPDPQKREKDSGGIPDRSGDPNPFTPKDEGEVTEEDIVRSSDDEVPQRDRTQSEEGVEQGSGEQAEQARELEQDLIDQTNAARDESDVVVERRVVEEGDRVARSDDISVGDTVFSARLTGERQESRSEFLRKQQETLASMRASLAFEDAFEGQQRRGEDYKVEQEGERFVARPTESFQREQATEQLEGKLEQQLIEQQLEEFNESGGDMPTEADLTAGKDFEVERTEEGFRATLTNEREQSLRAQVQFSGEDVTDSFERDTQRQPRTPEESFLSGVLSSVGISNPPRQEDVGEGIQDLVGVSNVSTVSEVADEQLDESDDEIRQGRENVSQAITNPDKGPNVGDAVIEFFDVDNSSLDVNTEYDDEAKAATENVRYGLGPIGSSVGPGGAVKGVTGGGRLLASSDDILKGAGIVGTASAVGIASGELEVPEEEESNELTPSRTVQGGAELDVESGETVEVEIGKTVLSSEVDAPERDTQTNPTTVQTVSTGVIQEQEQREAEDTREITEEDIATDLPEPEQRGPSVREQQRREDLNAPEREFPTGEDAVVGRGTAQESEQRTQESQQQEVAEGVDVGVGQEPTTRMPSIGDSDIVQDQFQDQDQFQAQRPAQQQSQIQQQVTQFDFTQPGINASEMGMPNVPGTSTGTPPGYGYPSVPITSTPSRPATRMPTPELSDGDNRRRRRRKSSAYGTEFDNPVADPSELDEVAASVEADVDFEGLEDL